MPFSRPFDPSFDNKNCRPVLGHFEGVTVPGAPGWRASRNCRKDSGDRGRRRSQELERAPADNPRAAGKSPKWRFWRPSGAHLPVYGQPKTPLEDGRISL